MTRYDEITAGNEALDLMVLRAEHLATDLMTYDRKMREFKIELEATMRMMGLVKD